MPAGQLRGSRESDERLTPPAGATSTPSLITVMTETPSGMDRATQIDNGAITVSYPEFDAAYRVWRAGLVGQDFDGIPWATPSADDLWKTLLTSLRGE